MYTCIDCMAVLKGTAQIAAVGSHSGLALGVPRQCSDLWGYSNMGGFPNIGDPNFNIVL